VPKKSIDRRLPRLRARLLRGVAAGLLLAGLAPLAQAQDAVRGRELYETHCLGCHYERIHNRDPARSLVRTLPQLRAEVAHWAGQTGRRFSPEDVDDIAEYLNQSHYRLTK
jgi:mono/diheme cytochrome c family protein